MSSRIKLSAQTAAGVIVLAAAVWYLAKEPEFRRDPLIEALGLARLAATYEASYKDCADERYERNADAHGLALAAIGRWAHAFPARSDAEAVRFAHAALPECRLDMLVRQRRIGWTRAQRRQRIVIDIDAH